MVQEPGDTLNLYCEATGNPSPTLVWMKDNVALTPTERLSFPEPYRLQLKKLEAKDGGSYACVFTNSVNSIRHMMRVVINGESVLPCGSWSLHGRSYMYVR
jgi:hypothetical protein